MCFGEYVGETLRVLHVRKKEHCDAIRLEQISKSAIAKHVHEQSMPHEIDWRCMKAIDCARWKRERKIREAFHIQKRANRNSIVMAVSNEAPFGMPLFDVGVGLYGEIVLGFRVLVVGRHRAVRDAPRVEHRLLCRSGLQ